MRYTHEVFLRSELFPRSFDVAYASSGDGKCFVTPSLFCKRRICAPGQPDSAPQLYKTRWNDHLRCLVDVRFDAPAASAARASLTALPRCGSSKDELILLKNVLLYALTSCSFLTEIIIDTKVLPYFRTCTVGQYTYVGLCQCICHSLEKIYYSAVAVFGVKNSDDNKFETKTHVTSRR